MRFEFAVCILTLGTVAIPVRARPADGSFAITTVVGEAFLGSPSGVVVPGAVMLAFSYGAPIGPSVAQSAAGFPLVTNLAGASITVTVNGTSVGAFVLATESKWIRALLPGNTPLGEGTLTVTYNGQTSEPYKVRVVERQLRLYDGSLCGPSSIPVLPSFCVPRAVQNLAGAGAVTANTLLTPARPGQWIALWGTGLGFAPGDERAGPIPGNLDVAGLRVIIGNQHARVVYAGRSGCCAGMDEILVEVPKGIEGCNVPAWVRFAEDGSATNDIFLSISAGEGACSDPQGLSEPEVRKLSGGNMEVAQIIASDGPQGGWGAWFGTAAGTRVIPFGTCRAYTWGAPFAADAPLDSLLDVGSTLSLQTPLGTFPAKRLVNGIYSGALNAPLEAGLYAVDNSESGPGGRRFRSEFSIPQRAFTWTNEDALTGLNPGDSVTVNWAAANPTGQVLLSGSLGVDGEISGGFLCYERPDRGTFTIPWAVIERFRAGSPNATEFRLAVGHQLLKRIFIPGFDVAEFFLPGPPTSKTIGLQ